MENNNKTATNYTDSSSISAVTDNIPEFNNSTIDPIWNDDATFFGQRMSKEEYEKQYGRKHETRLVDRRDFVDVALFERAEIEKPGYACRKPRKHEKKPVVRGQIAELSYIVCDCAHHERADDDYDRSVCGGKV